MTTANFDAHKAQAFGDRMLGVLNGAALALMTSVGHRTGLFDVMAGMPPADPAKIATQASRTAALPISRIITARGRFCAYRNAVTM